MAYFKWSAEFFEHIFYGAPSLLIAYVTWPWSLWITFLLLFSVIYICLVWIIFIFDITASYSFIRAPNVDANGLNRLNEFDAFFRSAFFNQVFEQKIIFLVFDLDCFLFEEEDKEKMWCNLRMLLLVVVLSVLHAASAINYSNSTDLMVIDEKFHGMPVYYKANFPVHMNSEQMRNHVRSILEPLTPYIMGSKDDTRVSRVRRQVPLDGSQFLGQLPPLNPPPVIIQVEEYKLPFIVGAQIGDYSFK